MTKLNDKKIRAALIERLSSRRPKPFAIKQEVSVHNGNAIADVVTFHRNMHCYEIKGETDSVQRVLIQSKFYNLSFNKLSLVTTDNHIAWSLNNLPPFWGVIRVYIDNGAVKFSYVRAASTNPLYDKKSAMLMLWKNELLSLSDKLGIQVKKSFSREDIASVISNKMNKETILNEVCLALKCRNPIV
ncbi:sce7726 family protein [Aeromonas jandaei]|uniref:sce7726 family protein n=1 Tax=Aeromonas jandaei TaxID=650 RepID=UPI003EC745B9